MPLSYTRGGKASCTLCGIRVRILSILNSSKAEEKVEDVKPSDATQHVDNNYKKNARQGG